VTIQAPILIQIAVLLFALVTVESGGYFLTRVVRRRVAANRLQQDFFRAGHAHAAVLLVLSIAVLAILGGLELEGPLGFLAVNGVPAAAVLMPAGFFLSVLGRDPQRPSRLIALLWVGVGALTVGLIAAGVVVLSAGIQTL
jgi:hypothetical protein